jgi:hypothetical protein
MRTINMIDCVMWVFILLNVVINSLLSNVPAVLGWVAVGTCMIRIHLYQIEAREKKVKWREMVDIDLIIKAEKKGAENEIENQIEIMKACENKSLTLKFIISFLENRRKNLKTQKEIDL